MGSTRPSAAPPRADHVVHLYDDDDAYYRGLVPYLADALRTERGALAIVTDEHACGLAVRLGDSGIDVERATARGQLVLLDARAAMAALAPGDSPHPIDPDAFAALIEARVDRMLDAWPAIAAVGEIVDLLAEAGRTDAVLGLEALWNGLLADRPLSLWCAYRLQRFGAVGAEAPFAAICAAHGDAHPLATPGASPDAGAAERSLRARIQQLTFALGTEAAERRAAEAHAARRHALTLALARCQAPFEVAIAAVDAVCDLAGAAAAQVQHLSDDGGREVLASRGMIEGEAARIASQTLAVRGAGADAEREPRAVAALSLAVGERRQGEILVGFAPPSVFPGRDRAAYDSLAAEIAQALERVRLAESAREARERLQRSERARDEMVATLGHELRNPLASILTAAEVMRMRDAGGREITVIERNSRRLGQLVDDLLDVTRLRHGHLRLRAAPHDIAPVVSWALELQAPLLAQGGHRVETALAPDLPRVDVDPERMAQVIAHLVGNAATYSPPGGRIEITATAQGASVEITVRDSGPGIPPALLPQLFEPFVQGPRGAARADGGLGVGLTLARRLTELHGGTLTVTSEVGGSAFCVRLPVARPADLDDASAARAAPGATKVLIVDDNEDAAVLAAAALRQRGYRVMVAHDGPAALVKAVAFEPDAILLDIGLPGLDGLEVARRLRDSGSSARLVAVTGYGLPADRDATREAGFDAHLVKPVTLASLEQAIVGCD